MCNFSDEIDRPFLHLQPSNIIALVVVEKLLLSAPALPWISITMRTRSKDQAQQQQQQQQQQDTANSAAVIAVAANNNNTTTTRTVTLNSGFPINDRTITIDIPSSSSSNSAANTKKPISMLKASGHHHPYRCFENYNYRFSNANDKDGTMVFLCDRARHPNGKDEWISNTSAWYRSRNKEAKTKPELKNLNIEDFRCTARLLVKVDISSNRDFASLTHPHECGGGIGNNAAAGDGGGEGGGIDDAQETADAHAVADVVGGGDEIIVDAGRNNAAAAQDPPAPALPNVNDNDNGIDNNGNDNGDDGGEAFLLDMSQSVMRRQVPAGSLALVHVIKRDSMRLF